MRQFQILFFAPVLLAGCATQANFTAALEEPAKLAASATDLVVEAQRDALRIYALKLTGEDFMQKSLVCAPSSTIQNLGGALGSFGASLDTIKSVGEAPADTAYTTYVKQFRKNAKYIREAKTSGTEQAMEQAATEADKERQAAIQRCETLYASDLKAVIRKSPGPNQWAAFGTSAFFALNELVKATLGAAEAAQREQAVRATARSLLPGLRKAHTLLADTPPQNFAPFVDYATLPAEHIAVQMNRTQLGATINLHRWLLAQKIEQLSQAVKTSGTQCFASSECRRNLDDLVIAVDEYRAVSAIDTGKILAALDEGIKKAKDAADGNMSWAQFLDGLLAIADAVNGINEKNKEFKTSKE